MSANSSKLERWLGKDNLEKLSKDMSTWYGPPIAVQGIPGSVFVHKGGDFRGHISEGFLCNAIDRAESIISRLAKRWRRASKSKQLNAGFSSLSDLISEATTGKSQFFSFLKNGAAGVVGVTNSLWRLGAFPAAGAAGSAAPGGRALTGATTGTFLFNNPTGGDTQHFVSGFPLASVAGNTLLLYDRIFDVAKTMNSTATESVTGVPSRYQSSTATAADYAGGNFIFVEVGGTALAATAHNWTTCLYRNQAGTDNATMPSLTGNSGAIVDRLDHPVGQWFAPLATGDTGAMDLAQMQCSAAVATGVINFVIGHPISWMPCPIANLVCVADGINTAFNLVRIFDNAALAFLEVCKPSTTATNYTGSFITVSG